MSILSYIVIYPCVVYAYLYIFIYTQETQFACPRAKMGIWHAQIHTCVHTCANIRTYIHSYAFTYIYSCIHACLCTQIHRHKHRHNANALCILNITYYIFYITLIIRQDPEVCPDSQRVSGNDDHDDDDNDDDDDGNQYAPHKQHVLDPY